VKLTGRTAVITGVSRGLGAGLARVFHAEGMRLGLCARSPVERWEWGFEVPLQSRESSRDAAVSPSAASPEGLHLESLDVRDIEALEGFARRVEQRFGGIDLWINNAGVLDPIGPLRDQTTRDVAENLEINVVGVVAGSQVFVRHLHRLRTQEPERAGVLVNISSGAARRPYAGWGAYCASKAAVDRLTECLQVEEAEHGLRAFSVAPGVIDTDMQAKIRACGPERFPEVERFWQLKRSQGFSSARFVARQLLELAFGTRDEPDEVLIRLPSEMPTS